MQVTPDISSYVRLAPGMPLASAARAALETSLGSLGERLAAPRGTPDNVAIDEIRLVAQRVIAALDIFRTTVGQMERRKLRKCARRLHLAARTVWMGRHQSALIGELLANAGDDRVRSIVQAALADAVEAAARSLARMIHLYRPRQFEPLRANLLASLREPQTLEPEGGTALEYGAADEAAPSKSRFRLIDAANHRLPRILQDLTNTAAMDMGDPENVRLLVRRIERLLHSLELFGSCMRDVIDDTAPIVADAMEHALDGEVRTDVIEFFEHLAVMHPDAADALGRLAGQLQSKQDEQLEAVQLAKRAVEVCGR